MNFTTSKGQTSDSLSKAKSTLISFKLDYAKRIKLSITRTFVMMFTTCLLGSSYHILIMRYFSQADMNIIYTGDKRAVS